MEINAKVPSSSVFEQASRVFGGWTDPDTGVRVLRVLPPGEKASPGGYATPYQQTRSFLDGGRRVLLRESAEVNPGGKRSSVLLDLSTGRIERPFPDGDQAIDVDLATGWALMCRVLGAEVMVYLFDVKERREQGSVLTDGWRFGGCSMQADGRRAVVAHYQGKYYDEPCRTHFHLLAPGEPPRVLLEMEGFYGNHMQGCPTDPDLYAYNAWPTPLRNVDGVARIASVDGRLDYPVPLDANAPRPADFWGVRDHYVWTPDGTRIVSYLNRKPVDMSAPFNHFEFDWWLSALDWRTGEDYCARYPPGRWGGHMHMTPDSRYILCGGGPGYDKLFAVDLQALKHGWNERLICGYPKTVSTGLNASPYPYPFALPDGSGVLFNAGWPGPEHGVYLAEWPKGWR